MRQRALAVPLFPLMFAIATAMEEALQGFSPHRTLDALDLLASFFGITLGYWLVQRHALFLGLSV